MLLRGVAIAAVPLVAAGSLGALSGSVGGGVYQAMFFLGLLTVWEWVGIRRQMRVALDTVAAMEVRDAGLAGLRQTLPLSLVVAAGVALLAFIGDWDLSAMALGLVAASAIRAVASDALIRFWERRDAQRYLLRVDIADDESLLREPISAAGR